MEQVRISQHLDARFGFNSGEVALCNLAYGTRILAQPDSWDKLAQFEVARELPADDSWLQRARSANLLVAPGDAPPDFILRLRTHLEAFLAKHQQAMASATHLELLERAEALFRQHHMPKGLPQQGVGPLMHKPERLVDFFFDHTRAFLTHDLDQDRDGVDVRMAQQFSERPAMKLRYEQQFCTPRTTQLRCQRIRQSLKPGSRVLVLGDDDLVSLALIAEPGDFQVDVLELDADLVAFLKAQGGERLTVLEHNLRHGVPESMREAYDVVTTDPPYAAEGMRFFLKCARESLAKKPGSRLFLSTFPGLIESPEELWADLEQLGFVIEERSNHFSRYIYNNSYRIEHLAALRHLGCPLHPTTELLGFPYLYAHFFECAISPAS